ncbi:MAG TPA: hypothetical protein PK357_00550 [Candidatus Pacearchaeota archaeon]|nr:hypothetical protein [Candidatus Pacearchaeota archaeon]
MQKKKREMFKNISNKFAYTIITLCMVVLLAIGVYALGTNNPSVFGHSAGELAPPTSCSANQVLTWTGSAWACTSPGATDSRFWINGSGLCYNAPATCKFETEYCNQAFYGSVNYGAVCSSLPSNTLSTICGSVCAGIACRGEFSSSCAGGNDVSYTAAGSCGSGSTYVECSCTAATNYVKETYILAGPRCI